MVAAGSWVWTWGTEGLTRQHRNLGLAKVVLVTFLSLALWLLAFSRARWVVRWLGLGAAVGLIVLTASLVRIRGVTGDLVPILEWRWRENVVPQIETMASIPTVSPAPVPPQDYPQFLGPNRTGVLPGPILARDWKERVPEPLWRRTVGAAWSGFAVAGWFAVTQEQRGEEESVVGYDLRSGQPLWFHADPAHYRTTIAGEGPRATPTLSSNRVFALGATGILNCLDLATGQRIWTLNIIQDNKSRLSEWGASSSPLVTDGLVIVSAGGKNGRSLVAYREATGEFAWGAGHDGAGYSSPAVGTLAGVRQILIFNDGGVAAHALDTGQLLWEYPWPKGHPHVTQPLILPGDQVLVASGYGIGAELLRITQTDPWSAQRVWKSNRLKPKFANVFHRDGFIYGLDDGILVCLDAAHGSLKWKEGRYGHGQAIFVGPLLLLMAEQGDVVLIEPKPDAPLELTRFSVFKDKTWNPPALAGEYLLVRNDKEAACFRLPIVK